MTNKKELINKDAIADIIFALLQGRLESEIIDGYNSPLREIVNEVIKENEDKIREVYNDMLNDILNESFNMDEEIRTEFRRKVAKNLVAKLEGQVESAVSVLRQDPKLKAKMIVAIEKIIKKNS